MNFRAMEVTLSSGFTGNYLEDDPSFYVALGLYGRFEIGMRRDQSALPAPLRQCLASSADRP